MATIVIRRAIVYFSEQGTAKGIAEEIGRKTGIDVVDVNAFDIDNIKTYGFLIFVPASYGRGSPPRNCTEAWAKLQNVGRLDGLKFAVWGVGSSAFRRSFLGFAKEIENKMKELGAEEVTTLGISDEQHEQDVNLDEWLKTLGISLPK